MLLKVIKKKILLLRIILTIICNLYKNLCPASKKHIKTLQQHCNIIRMFQYISCLLDIFNFKNDWYRK